MQVKNLLILPGSRNSSVIMAFRPWAGIEKHRSGWSPHSSWSLGGPMEVGSEQVAGTVSVSHLFCGHPSRVPSLGHLEPQSTIHPPAEAQFSPCWAGLGWALGPSWAGCGLLKACWTEPQAQVEGPLWCQEEVATLAGGRKGPQDAGQACLRLGALHWLWCKEWLDGWRKGEGPPVHWIQILFNCRDHADPPDWCFLYGPRGSAMASFIRSML